MADNLPSGTEFRAGRSDSTASAASSTGSSSAATAPSWAGVKQQAATAATTATQATRRASQGAGSPTFRRPSHPLFEGLTAQKRKDDAESVARRQSMSEQRPAAGFIGQMWNNWVYGKK